MKILNLYAGIGGNRKLWGNEHEITAVEYNPDIAKVYQEFFPNDTVIIADAHQYLLDHYKEFDFIWASPPCPTHSTLVFSNETRFYANKEMRYPDMTLYQEILLLMSFAPKKTRWCIENVKPYYKPLIPAKEIARHLFWTNFDVTYKKIETDVVISGKKGIEGNSTVFGVDLRSHKIKNKRQILRNMVNPEVGLHILKEAIGDKTVEPGEQQLMF